MSEAEQAAREWMRFARADLRAAQGTQGSDVVEPRHVAFNAQQAAEKALKAILVLHEITFPFTHDLEDLRPLLPPGSRAKGESPQLSSLTQAIGRTRYPYGEELTAEAVAEMVDVAAAVVELAAADIEAGA